MGTMGGRSGGGRFGKGKGAKGAKGREKRQGALFKRRKFCRFTVEKAEWIVVPLFVGSNIVWALTGAARTPWRRLLPLALAGIAARLALLWWLSGLFEDELRSVVDWLTRYQLWIIIASVALVLLANLRNFRRLR